MAVFSPEVQKFIVLISKEDTECLEMYELWGDFIKGGVWFNCLLGEGNIHIENGISIDE